ncbi:right-handed parallel beta-helix repeat-containing protein [Nonomuraea spiralis]|uniref:Right-handed parallel beta-helix repeat-containing protein n=1 Tax=Nonomuraea spiralis TaxID=46182 RepID=A0ABV5IYL1_9ACTN|nr:right-handed parallel beta-helix repeat-containing protein [Nonomuraea spiralis]
MRRIAILGVLTFGLLLPGGAALAHEERPVTLPDGTGTVPALRTGEPDLLVCKDDKADFERRIANFPAELRQRNLDLFAKCQQQGVRNLQDAVDRVQRPGMTIAILPGLYREEPSQAAPTGACARLPARWSSWGYQILTFEQQLQCPHNQNLVAVLGKKDLQIEGTGAGPLDVIVDAEYRKLNAIRADRTDGVYFRNFTAQRTTFNSLYVLETDGFVIDRVLTRWNDEYGFLTFASDHGLYTDCEAYGNGDGGLYPGSASNLNDGRGHDVPRYAIEIRRCKSHDNALGYSGTAGDSMWVHDNEFYDNMVGATMDSLWPGHPGLPQNHAKFENNKIYDNNRYTRDGTCARPPAERGYEHGVVCSQVGVPPGTGILVAGGNYNVFRNNRVWGHRRAAFQLFGVPAFIRGENDLAKQADTSNHNRYEGNVFGVGPAGERRPNGLDVWWDGQGTGNCWQGDAGRSTPAALPVCAARAPELSAGTSRVLAEPVKLAKLYLCADFSAAEARLPAGCDWFGESGLGKVEAQLALGGSVVLALFAVLFWRRSGATVRLHKGGRGAGPSANGVAPAVTYVSARRHALIVAGALGGLAGLTMDVVAATEDSTLLAALALLLMADWWLCLGVALRPRRPAFGWLTIVLGLLACVDAFDRVVYSVPFVPVGPGWVRGLLTGVWVLCAVVVLAPRRGRTEDAPAAGARA